MTGTGTLSSGARRFYGVQTEAFRWRLDGKVANITSTGRSGRTADLRVLRGAARHLPRSRHAEVSRPWSSPGAAISARGDVHEIIGPLVERRRVGDMGGLLPSPA